MKEALYWKKLKDKKVQCELCPRNCVVLDGKFGNCKARKNINGKLWSMNYPHAIGPNIDPIEKKPLYHFLPGSEIFSFGAAGCNLHCLHCQNYSDSQSFPKDVFSAELPPEKIVELAKQNNCPSVAYTYTEPTIFFEYMLETAKLAKKQKLKNVSVSNGFINPEPLKKIAKYLDAANIDLKGDDKFYKEECMGWGEPVLETLKILKEKKVWTEITYLVIPGMNDSKKQVEKTIRWILENLGENIPLHFTAFYPTYQRLDKPPTNPEILKKLRKLAMNLGLNYVYTGNIPDEEGSTTFCPKCKKAVIRRQGFLVLENSLKNGKCACGKKIPGVWE